MFHSGHILFSVRVNACVCPFQMGNKLKEKGDREGKQSETHKNLNKNNT